LKFVSVETVDNFEFYSFVVVLMLIIWFSNVEDRCPNLQVDPNKNSQDEVQVAFVIRGLAICSLEYPRARKQGKPQIEREKSQF